MARIPNTPGSIEHDIKTKDVNFTITLNNGQEFPPGYTVQLIGDFDSYLARGAQPIPIPMTWDGAQMRYRTIVPSLIIGQNYSYFIRVKNPSGGVHLLEPQNGRYNTGPIPESAAAPLSPIMADNEVAKNVRSKVKSILDALKTAEGASGLDDLVDAMQVEMNGMGLTGNHTALLLRIISDALADREDLPGIIRAHFKGKKPPVTLDELEQRLRDGSNAFRSTVFRELVADPKARKALHLNSGDRHFHDPHTLSVFNRVCDKYALSSDSIAYVCAAFDKSANMPPVSPNITPQMSVLRDRIVKRLTPEERSLLSEVPPGRWAKIVDVVVQLGAAGLLFTGSAPLLGAGLLVGKSAIEKLTGLSTADYIEAFGGKAGHSHKEGLAWKLFRNNIVAKLLVTKQTAAQESKDQLRDFLKRCIPGSAFWYGGKSVSGAHYGPEEHAEHGEEEEEGNAEKIIRAAFEKYIK